MGQTNKRNRQEGKTGKLDLIGGTVRRGGRRATERDDASADCAPDEEDPECTATKTTQLKNRQKTGKDVSPNKMYK